MKSKISNANKSVFKPFVLEISVETIEDARVLATILGTQNAVAQALANADLIDHGDRDTYAKIIGDMIDYEDYSTYFVDQIDAADEQANNH